MDERAATGAPVGERFYDLKFGGRDEYDRRVPQWSTEFTIEGACNRTV